MSEHGLDVGLLARALHKTEHPAVSDCRLGLTMTPRPAWAGRRKCEVDAERLAAEYAGLASKVDTHSSSTKDPEPNVEAGDYIEDDPEAWVSWVETVRRYAPEYEPLVRHLNGGEEAASEILAGTMLSYLADRHGIFLIRGDAVRVQPPSVSDGGPFLAAKGQEAIQHVDGEYLALLSKMVREGKARNDPTLAVAISIDMLGLLVAEVESARGRYTALERLDRPGNRADGVRP